MENSREGWKNRGSDGSRGDQGSRVLFERMKACVQRRPKLRRVPNTLLADENATAKEDWNLGQSSSLHDLILLLHCVAIAS